MDIPLQTAISNKLLALLPAADFEEVAGDLQHVYLPRGTPIGTSGQPIDYLYFLTSGIGSVIARTPDGHRAEAGLFGFDGYVPTSAVADVELHSHDMNIQVDAEAYRMTYADFRRAMETNRNFSRVVVRAMEAFSIQLAYTLVSNAIHDVTVRLARWLLMCHDRVQGDEIALTHEYLAIMLAVRRPSVTTSLHLLEGSGFITSGRGKVTIRNRPGLQMFARDAYGRPEEEYRRLMKNLF